jgi:hypothetical protein
VSEDFDARYAEKVSQADKEARHRRAVAKIAEPLLRGLQPGAHYFPPVEFRALVQFLFEGEPQKAARAMRSDTFSLLKLEFFCKRDLSEDNMTTISVFARERGIPQRTIHDRAAKAGLKPLRRLGKLLYDIKQLTALLAEGRG